MSTYYVSGAIGDTGNKTGNKKVKERNRKQVHLQNVWEARKGDRDGA